MRLKTTPYIPIRDDGSSGVLFSQNEQELVRQALLLEHTLRMDGRSPSQLRPAKIQLTRSSTDGTTGCTVQWGNSIAVHCLCQGQIVPPPNMDRPNEGSVQIAVELSPMASTSFKYGLAVTNGGGGASGKGGGSGGGPLEDSQKLAANRILRCLENLLGHCLDSEALVIVPGQWVWQLQLRITSWDCGSSTYHGLLDASVLATLAALRHYRQPSTNSSNSNGTNNSSTTGATAPPPQTQSLDLKEGTPLPLHHTPLSISFAWLTREGNSVGGVGGHYQHSNYGGDDDDDDDLDEDRFVVLVDPSWQEQCVANGNELSLQLNVHGEICGLVSSGVVSTTTSTSLLRRCHKLALALIPQLSQSLETTLQQAHEQAMQQGLERLQQQHQQKVTVPPSSSLSTMQVDEDVAEAAGDKEEESSVSAATSRRVLEEAEERYRKQALEYNLGHQAVQVRDNATTKDTAARGSRLSQPTSSRLLQSLLQAASKQAQEDLEADAQAKKARVNLTAMSATDQDGDDDEALSTTRPRKKWVHNATGVSVIKAAKQSSSVDARDEAMLEVSLESFQQGVRAREEEEEETRRAATAATRLRILENDDDEEEEEEATMQLHSEFSAFASSDAQKQPAARDGADKETENPNDNDKEHDEEEEDEVEGEDYDAIKAYNKKYQDMEEEEAFWEGNRNTNRASSSGADETNNNKFRGADKIKGGRIPTAGANQKTAEGEKPTKAEARRKGRNMAKRRDQQKKAMFKRNG